MSAGKVTPDQNLSQCVERLTEHLLNQLQGKPPEGLFYMVQDIVEDAMIRSTLRFSQGNQSEAAKILGISRTTLRNKIKAHRQ